jgi:hypothetical protein
MSNFRTNNAITVTATQTGSLTNAWGILIASGGATGVLRLERRYIATGSYTTMSLAHITSGIPFPCYVTSVEVASGTVYVLA